MNPYIFLITGEPGLGKTSLASYIRQNLFGVSSISIDWIIHELLTAVDYRKFRRHDRPGLYNIFDYLNSDEADISSIHSEINTVLEYCSDRAVIIEGYLGPRESDLKNQLIIDGYKVSSFKIESDRSIKSHLQKFETDKMNFGSFSNYIEKFIVEDAAHEIYKSVNYKYQIFDNLPIGNQKGIDCSIKLKDSKMLNYIYLYTSVLDIGCNIGYFCFQAANKTHAQVCGYDANENVLTAASNINRFICGKENIVFTKTDVYEIIAQGDDRKRFDLVICFGFFHYMRDRQELFVRYIHAKLRRGGRAIVEVEVAPKIFFRSKKSLIQHIKTDINIRESFITC